MDGKGSHLGFQGKEPARRTKLANDEGLVVSGIGCCFLIDVIIRARPDLGRYGSRNARHDREEESKLTQVSHEISPVPKLRLFLRSREDLRGQDRM